MQAYHIFLSIFCLFGGTNIWSISVYFGLLWSIWSIQSSSFNFSPFGSLWSISVQFVPFSLLPSIRSTYVYFGSLQSTSVHSIYFGLVSPLRSNLIYFGPLDSLWSMLVYLSLSGPIWSILSISSNSIHSVYLLKNDGKRQVWVESTINYWVISIVIIWQVFGSRKKITPTNFLSSLLSIPTKQEKKKIKFLISLFFSHLFSITPKITLTQENWQFKVRFFDNLNFVRY